MSEGLHAATAVFGGSSASDVVRARAYAPLLRLHPNEKDYPVDPIDFIKNARFRRHDGFGFDDGFDKVKKAWVIDSNDHDAAYYDVPVAIINQFTAQPDGKNRRPRDENAGDENNVFLETKDPFHGSANFPATVPAFFWMRQIEFDVQEIQYWFFYGYNDGVLGFNHQGDWEHVRVRIKGNDIQCVDFAAHFGMTRTPIVECHLSNGRPVVYVAKGTHASYPAKGTYAFAWTDEAADGGIEWDTAPRLAPLDKQPWRDFAGAWGKIGTIEETTGPLGPWLKKETVPE